MKLKNLLITIIFLGSFTFSCKKESNSTISKDMQVRYEVTWAGTLNASYSGIGYNQLAYINNTGNTQSDNLPIPGNSYTKTVTIPSSVHLGTIIAQFGVVLNQPGTGEIKVYVNDKLVASQTAMTTITGSTNFNVLVLNVHWTVI
jgi:hypothetical protein